jgi:hypothetical protein
MSRKSPKIVSIKIHNVIRAEEAEPLMYLKGQSYLNLNVELCPVGGSFDVNVTTLHPKATKAELTAMVLGILAHDRCRNNRVYELEQPGPTRPF